MKEYIGNVCLDLSQYAGDDRYSDGSIEDEILAFVQNHPNPYDSDLEIYRDWAMYYHLSSYRKNIIKWYPFQSGDKVLEIGAGCGAVTGAFLDKGCLVTCSELSKRRSLINAYRHKSYDHLEIKVGNFEDLSINKTYDYVTLIGVFEYANCFINDMDPYGAMLKKIKRYLTSEGTLLIAIENKLGMKYWAGCKEDHTGQYFEGIENYTLSDGAKTFSKKEWESMLKENGYHNYKFYYPYPDYKFTTCIYSDEFLPKSGELFQNNNNWDQDRIQLFDESKAFDNIIQSGYFPDFSNSFLIMAKKDGEGL